MSIISMNVLAIYCITLQERSGMAGKKLLNKLFVFILRQNIQASPLSGRGMDISETLGLEVLKSKSLAFKTRYWS